MLAFNPGLHNPMIPPSLKSSRTVSLKLLFRIVDFVNSSACILVFATSMGFNIKEAIALESPPESQSRKTIWMISNSTTKELELSLCSR